MNIVSELIDAAATVPFIVWAAIVAFGAVVWIAYEIGVAPLLTPEQEEEIAEAHRELRGARYEDVCTPPAGARRTGTRGSATMPRVSSSSVESMRTPRRTAGKRNASTCGQQVAPDQRRRDLDRDS